jgi:hypothetical protein
MPPREVLAMPETSHWRRYPFQSHGYDFFFFTMPADTHRGMANAPAFT